ncbi:hypothetical protein D3C73_1376250 [compost metagenome]
MERTTRMIIFALLFQLNSCIDEIDDVGSCQQVINEYTWDSSSHMPRYYTSSFKLSLRWLRSLTPVTYLSKLRGFTHLPS